MVLFSNSKPRRVLSYSNKQLISREIDIEKMRMCENFKFDGKADKKGTQQSNKPKDQSIPNHLQKLNVKNIKKKSDSVSSRSINVKHN